MENNRNILWQKKKLVQPYILTERINKGLLSGMMVSYYKKYRITFDKLENQK